MTDYALKLIEKKEARMRSASWKDELYASVRTAQSAAPASACPQSDTPVESMIAFNQSFICIGGSK